MPRFPGPDKTACLIVLALAGLLVSGSARPALATGVDDVTGKASPAAAGSNTAGSNTAESSGADLDAEQRSAAEEEFQAITDRTTAIQVEEMPAYWRLLQWVHEQPLAQLRSRAVASPTLDDLVQRPGPERGRLLRLELNVVRALGVEIPNNDTGLQRLYEIWGWSNASGTRLYVGVVPELPPGFPTGAELSERATLYGYFFKLQGYLEAKAAPRSKPLAAPLIIGRLAWQPKAAPRAMGTESIWMVGLVILALIFVLARVLLSFLYPKRTAGLLGPRTTGPLPTADQWWDRIQTGATSTEELRHARPTGDDGESE